MSVGRAALGREALGHPAGSMDLVEVSVSADSIDGGWVNEVGSNVNLFASIDEVVADTADYIRSEDNPVADLCKLKLADLGAVLAPMTINYQYRKVGGTSADLTVRLLQDVTEIAAWDHVGIGETYVTVSQTLTAPEFAAITDFSDLYVEFEANP